MTFLAAAGVVAVGYVAGRRLHRRVRTRYLNNSLMR